MSILRFLFFASVIALLPVVANAQLISIAQARTLGAGATVTVRGVVSSGAELGKIRYMQDGTAGIAAFPGTGSQAGFEAAVTLGDSVEVTGLLVNYYGLLEMTPITHYQVIATGQTVHPPKPVSLNDLSNALESQLVSMDCVTFNDGGSTFTGAGTFKIVDTDGVSANVYMRSGHPMTGSAIPSTPVHLVAIVSNFTGVQLLIRNSADFSAAQCFFYVDPPVESNITLNGADLNWTTNLPTTSKLHYGTTPNPTTVVTASGTGTAHAVTLSGLQDGTVYWVQAEATRNNETILSEVVPFVTRSLSSGEIKVYFNHPIDESYTGGLLPNGQTFQTVLDETIARINAAQQTIDVAMYNNTRTDITAALSAAVARGVRVRYVAALDASSPALNPPPVFPVIYGNASAIMHDKFMVVDVTNKDKCWVMGGSMNWTNVNMINDYNNTLFIQDQSLARTYTLEFEEMWGGSGPQPDAINSKFGSAKKDNTPHHFVIGGIPVESYFSPSDHTTNRIVQTIATADHEALFALLVFTKEEQTQELIAVRDNGASIRGMIEDYNDVGSEYNYMLANGINVVPHSYPGTLHHKYVVVDAGFPTSAPVVLTGSHNWSYSAETANDENTLILHDNGIALLYKGEFEKRWSENGLTPAYTPAGEQLNVALFPNPAATSIRIKGPEEGFVTIQNTAGDILSSTRVQENGTTQLSIEQLPAGLYFAVIQTINGRSTVPFQKI